MILGIFAKEVMLLNFDPTIIKYTLKLS